MPNGYSRTPLPSPWRGAGAGIGSLIAGLLMKPQREREEQEEQIQEAWEQAKMTGDKSQLSKLRERYPKAVKRFEEERGLELPFAKEVPETQATLPGGGAVTLPGMETAPTPWPAIGAGMQVRDVHERMAGRPGAPTRPQEPGDALSQAVRVVANVPQDQKQTVYDSFRAKNSNLPEVKFKPTEDLGPVSVRETAAVEAVWKLTDPERAMWHERHQVPTRAPDELDPTMPRPLAVGEFARIFQVTPEQIMTYQFTKKVPASLKLRTTAAEPKSWLMKWASQIAERTRGARKALGEEPEQVWDVAKAIMNGTYNFEMYQSSLAVDEEVQSLKMMLLQARQMKPRNKAAEKELSMQMAEKLGIDWKSGTAFMDFLMALVTPQYGQSVTQPAPSGKPMTDEEALKGGIKR